MAEEQDRPRTVQDLVRHLADTLVEQEVCQPMEAIGWSHGDPPPPKPADDPPGVGGAPAAVPAKVPAPAATTAAPAMPTGSEPPAKADMPKSLAEIDVESFKDPVTGKYGGKYDTPTEFVRGIGHAVQMAKQAFTREAAATAEVARLQNELELSRRTPPAASPAAAPAPSALDPSSRVVLQKAQDNYDEVLRKVVEEGGLLDGDSSKSLSAAQRELARAEAKVAVEESLLQRDGAVSAEQRKWNAVNEFMEKNHPESLKFADEIGLYVQSEPLVQEAISALVAQGKEQRAAELAWKEFDSARSNGALAASKAAATEEEIKLQAGDQVRKEAVEAARKDAGISGTSASGVHERTDNAPSQDEINAAADAMRAYGMQPGNPAAARWRELTIGKSLPPEIFGS